jgi:hypothetical protein
VDDLLKIPNGLAGNEKCLEHLVRAASFTPSGIVAISEPWEGWWRRCPRRGELEITSVISFANPFQRRYSTVRQLTSCRYLEFKRLVFATGSENTSISAC